MFHSDSKAFNLAYYSNKEFEDLLGEAAQLEGVDRAKASELYIQAQRILYNDVPAIPLWDMVDVRVALAKIKRLEITINPAYPAVIFPQALSVEG
jgi:peptide/nickel transport system substrate-binding protein